MLEYLIINFYSNWIPEPGITGPGASVCVYAGEHDEDSVMLVQDDYEGNRAVGEALVEVWKAKLVACFGPDIKVIVNHEEIM